ncbi:hypothetical protein [Neisseria uirgultaei]|uniref:hypothetical protein n=1 Tax=Neisseria uirgultaei TaxID=2830646 RepID=UPI00265A9B69|nr:hypothetical protein [Neisseria uirgultaei]
MAKALEIISPNEIYSDLIFKDLVSPHTYFVIPTAFVIPTKVGIQNPEAAGIYRKKPKPDGLDSRLRGNDGKNRIYIKN